MADITGKTRLSPPLMYVFRAAHEAKDATKKLDIRTEAEVARILVQGNRVKGVALAGGVVTVLRTLLGETGIPDRLGRAPRPEPEVDTLIARIKAVAGFMPEAVPALLAEDGEAGMFAMGYLLPQSFEGWITQLQRGHVMPATAAEMVVKFT